MIDSPAEVGLRLLSGASAEMVALQRVLEAAPVYVGRITGAPPGAADAQSLYTVLPPNKSYHDKFVFGIELHGAMVGCIDLVRGYPERHVAHLGLLLIAEPFQRRGLGAAAFRLVEAHVRRWETCTTMRATVVRTNAEVLAFWHRVGFAPTGERKPYRYGSVVSEVVVLTKPLADAAP